jgi:hypothetical protein
MSTEPRILKPLPLPLALLYFGIPALIFVLCVYPDPVFYGPRYDGVHQL